VPDKQEAERADTKKPLPATLIIVLVVVAMFAGVLLAKTLTKSPTKAASIMAGTAGTTGPAQGTPLTSTHNDAVADYEAAAKTGKPIYVLFHSLS
jgi:flagellar basal body-associated protein FliL